MATIATTATNLFKMMRCTMPPLFGDRTTDRPFFDCGSIIRLVGEQDTHEWAISVLATTSWVSKKAYA
jgi:hypothetical protein